jgi:hypothetical protein
MSILQVLPLRKGVFKSLAQLHREKGTETWAADLQLSRMRDCHITGTPLALMHLRWLTLPFQLSSFVRHPFYKHGLYRLWKHCCEIWPWRLQSVILGISPVIPRDSHVSLAAKNPFHWFGKDIGGYSRIYRGVRVISNIWLMIYCLEETFICGSVARPHQTQMMKAFMRNELASSIIISRGWLTGRLCHCSC